MRPPCRFSDGLYPVRLRRHDARRVGGGELSPKLGDVDQAPRHASVLLFPSSSRAREKKSRAVPSLQCSRCRSFRHDGRPHRPRRSPRRLHAPASVGDTTRLLIAVSISLFSMCVACATPSFLLLHYPIHPHTHPHTRTHVNTRAHASRSRRCVPARPLCLFLCVTRVLTPSSFFCTSLDSNALAADS